MGSSGMNSSQIGECVYRSIIVLNTEWGIGVKRFIFIHKDSRHIPYIFVFVQIKEIVSGQDKRALKCDYSP